MSDEQKFSDTVKNALALIAEKPRDIARVIENTADAKDVDFPHPLIWLRKYLENCETNSAVFHALGIALRKWDRENAGAWVNGTPPYSLARRELIYQLLKLPDDFHDLLNRKVPIFQESDRAVVIAEKHEEWYSKRVLNEGFFWKAYATYLQKAKRWDDDAVAKLDQSTDEVVSRLSNPCRPEIYASKGLVVGYVQSGKTANFSGVLAKAADAGYRFIIVLAGTLDILRAQTQRRLDKELVGKELLKDDYVADDDWDEFLSHGGVPSELGAFDWERLTGPDGDYRELKHGIAALEFKTLAAGQTYNDPENLRFSPLRLIVIKKIPKVMARLAKDLAKIRTKLANVPTLIVDDESDQASVNTIDPSKKPTGQLQKSRTATNSEIVRLLKTLPRAQYLGYTATPFANVFVDPDDAEDLFPKDFIISLPRPKGYMGVMDFYDFDSEPEGFNSNEKAFIRDVRGEDCGGDIVDSHSNPNHLQQAIDSFVLAGAIKLFREHHSNGKYFYKHHTMLVHHSVSKADHDQLADKVRETFVNAGYYGGAGVKRLKQLLKDDFQPVTMAKGQGLPIPASFKELETYVAKCLARLTENKTVLIVNGDNKDDTPNFDKTSVWAILVGGTKLSRGYTVEGLTVTYFRRVSSTTDTLMQMGRWFGYRLGYGDLVRLFIGRAEPFKGKSLDLYDAFEAICRDEEKFRQEIAKYSKAITPKEMPPLVPSHLTALRPTAKNKMYNAKITFKNFGGDWSERTLAPNEKIEAEKNDRLAISLLASANWEEVYFSGLKKDRNGNLEKCEVKASCGNVTNSKVFDFLNNYCWSGGLRLLQHEIDFIKGGEGNPEIDDWEIVIPIVNESREAWPMKKIAGIPQIPIQKRSRLGGRFKVYTTSSHRAVAEYISSIGDRYQALNNGGKNLRKSQRAVMLFYPVMDDADLFVTMGFALLFPLNHIPKQISYSVKDKNRPNEIIVPLDSDHASA